MSPLLRAAGIVAGLSALAALADWLDPSPAAAPSHDAPSAEARELPVPCPKGTLLDGNACVPVPTESTETDAHQSSIERIPLYPGRPSNYSAYGLPLPPESLGPPVPELHPTAGGSKVPLLRLPAAPGTSVRLVTLEGQVGDARVAFVGPLFGDTVITRHEVKVGKRTFEHFVIHAGLDEIGVSVGQTLRGGVKLAKLAQGDDQRDTGLGLAVRRVRDGAGSDLEPNSAAQDLLSPLRTLDVDPRNVLPRSSPQPAPGP